MSSDKLRVPVGITGSFRFIWTDSVSVRIASRVRLQERVRVTWGFALWL